MATPLIAPGSCCLCWGQHDGGTFDVTPDGYLMLVDVCFACRWLETEALIRRQAV